MVRTMLHHARENPVLDKRALHTALMQLKLGTVENFLQVSVADLALELRELKMALGERTALQRAHAHFAELLGSHGAGGIADAAMDEELEAQIDATYAAASMGRQSAQNDRTACVAES
mmetsp:Transcript_1260/g.2637  ORF Transcript_1260/g.2637 Transcript_1260/m.2637 type:complete len:118 (-) Transcript_1260:261-614(-)